MVNLSFYPSFISEAFSFEVFLYGCRKLEIARCKVKNEMCKDRIFPAVCWEAARDGILQHTEQFSL
jgi:hypothetical protein